MKLSQVLQSFPKFIPHETGGGCVCLRWKLSNGEELLLLADDGERLPNDDDREIRCAHFSDSGSFLSDSEDGDVVSVEALSQWIAERQR